MGIGRHSKAYLEDLYLEKVHDRKKKIESFESSLTLKLIGLGFADSIGVTKIKEIAKVAAEKMDIYYPKVERPDLDN